MQPGEGRVNSACRRCNQRHPVHALLYQLFCAAHLRVCLLHCNDKSFDQIVIANRDSTHAHLAHAAVFGGAVPATSTHI